MSNLKKHERLLRVTDNSNSPFLELNDVILIDKTKTFVGRRFYMINLLGEMTIVIVGRNKDGTIFFYKANNPELKFNVEEEFFNKIVFYKIIWYARSLCKNTPIADPLYDDEVNGELYKKKGFFAKLFS